MRVRDLLGGTDVSQPLLVREAQMRESSAGPFLKLVLADRSGTVTAVVREDLDAARTHCRPGEVVWVDGRFEDHARHGSQLVVTTTRPASPHEYTREDLSDGPSHPPEQMESDLRELIATVHNPHLRRLLAAVFGETSPLWPRFREAPAAKRYHQAYRHGLLEHCLTVAQAVSATSATFPGIDRDIAVTGALVHDIGKLDAYELEGETIAMSDQGRLFGEIALGYYLVRRLIDGLEGFPSDLADAVLHIILSHHGSLDHGSPVVPCTREATLVHMIDNLGGRLGTFDRLERELPAGAQWSAYDRVLGGGAYFGTAGPTGPAAARRAA